MPSRISRCLGDEHAHESIVDGHSEVSWAGLVTGEQSSIGEVAPTSDAPDPRALAALGARDGSRARSSGRGPSATWRSGPWMRCARRSPGRRRALPASPRDRPSLPRFITSTGRAPRSGRGRHRLRRRGLAAGGRKRRAHGFPRGDDLARLRPLLPAAESWLVRCAHLREAPGGIVVAAPAAPLSLDPTAATVLTMLGDLLASGIPPPGCASSSTPQRSNVSAGGWRRRSTMGCPGPGPRDA